MLSHYDNKQAREYDTRSEFDKGDRQRQRFYLLEAVGFCARPIERFVELGSGTGYFSELLLQEHPAAMGLLVDESEAMLTEAKRRLAKYFARVTLERGRIGSVPLESPWNTLDLVFSAMTFHLLTPEDRRVALEQAHASLAPGGILVLIGRFLAADPEHASLLEYLACGDMRRRMAGVFGAAAVASPDMQIAQVIQRDQRRELEEPNFHMTVEEYIQLVRDCGYENTHVLFLEARIFGLLARKPGVRRT